MKLRILSIGLLAFILIAGCEETKRIFSAPRAVPAFDLKINLDSKAEKELRDKKETIKIIVDLSGRPRKDSGIKDNNKAVGYIIDSFSREMSLSEIGTNIRFDNLKIPQNIYDALEEKDYSVSIAVISGRKSSSFNLLNCDHLSSGISRIRDQQHEINCKLIRDPK